MKPLAALVLFLSTAAFSGCALIINGRTQDVVVETEPSGAQCSVGQRLFKSPALLRLSRATNHLIRCVADGKEQIMPISGRLSAWTFCSGIFFPIDFMTGAAFRLVPGNVSLQLAKPGEPLEQPRVAELLPWKNEAQLYAQLKAMRLADAMERARTLTFEERKRLEEMILTSKGETAGWRFIISAEVPKSERELITAFLKKYSDYKPKVSAGVAVQE